MNKKAMVGNFVFMMYRLVLVTLAATSVLFICSSSYSYQVNILDSEARILARNAVECLIEENLINNPEILTNEEIKYDLLNYCKIKGDLSRYYISIDYDLDGEKVKLESGDSGITFVRELVATQGSELIDYQPGYYIDTFNIYSKEIKVEVFVNAN